MALRPAVGLQQRKYGEAVVGAGKQPKKSDAGAAEGRNQRALNDIGNLANVEGIEVNDLVCISDRAYFHEQILAMEKIILGKLEWALTVPTPYVFLVCFIKASIPDQQLENMVHFLAVLGMMQYAFIMYCPSMFAASAVFAARCTLNKNPAWNDALASHRLL